MIFDDVACDKQNNIRAYFSMGRHNFIDSFYLYANLTLIYLNILLETMQILLLYI